MTKPNLPTEKKLPTKAESLLAQASATVKKENERKSALTAAGVKDIAKYDSAYAPLKNFDKDITSLYTEINDLGRFYTATDKQLGSAKTNAQKMKNRIGQINSFLDTYGNLYDENTIKAMRSDLADIDSTLTDWLGKASADDYLEKLNSPASVDTTSVATAIRDKESEKARAERGGRDTTEISNELNALYDNGGAYGAAAKRRSEYNANKAALATAKAELEKIAEGDPVERQKAWENGTSYQYEQEIANRLTEKRAEIDALEAKINLYEQNAYADDVWFKVFGSGEDLSAYENVTYGKNEDPIAYIAKTTVEPFEASSFNNALSADERVVYNYLLKNKGVKAAQKWLDSGAVRDTINQRIGQAEGAFINERFNSNLPKTVLASAYGIAGGIGNYANGLIAPVAATVNPTALSTPASIYANQEASKDLGFVGKALSDASVSIGNMAPSIVLGAVNPVLGQASFGVSAAGNAYNEARKEGKTVEQAALYGIVSGASEVFLQNVLGGIPGISGASNKLVNAAKNLKIPALRALAVYGIDMAGEATEEYLQDILEPMFRNAIFNEDNEVKIFTGEAAYSAMLGALTSAILNIPTLSTKSTKQLGASMIQGGWYDTLLDNALKLDKDSNAFDLANKLKNGELTASEMNIGELLRAYKADDGDLSFLEEKGTVEKMPNSTVTESVDNLKAETNPSELKGEALVLNLLADGEVSNSKAKKILEDPEAMKTIGADVEGLDTISKKRAVIKEAMQNYIAQNAEKIASNAQKETTAQTATNTATEAQSEDADTFQYKHIVEKQKLGTRLLSELEGRTSKTGEKLADKLTAMATSITGDEDANRAVYKLFANPRYAAAASIEDGAGFLEIIRNFKTDAGRNFARQQMSEFINNAATAATLTELLRKDVNVTLENAAGMKPAEGKSAPKGYYDESDHRVAIADNLLTYETLVGTIAHEGFHANGAIDRELVNNFAKTLEGLWGKDKNGNSVWEATVKRKKDSIEAYTGKPTTTLKAEEEVCAEALTKLFNTQKAWDVMGEMFGKIEGSDRLLNRIKNSLDRFFANFKKRFKGEMPAGKLTTFRENLEHLIKETKGDVKTAKESKKESKKEAKKETATDAELDAELEAELAEETEQTAKPEKNDAVGYKTKPTDSEAGTPTETKKAPAEEDEEVELVSDLYDAEAKGGRMYSVEDTEVNTTKISAETSDAEREKILRGKTLVAPIYDAINDKTIQAEKENLSSKEIGLVKKALVRVGEEFSVAGNYKNRDLEVEISVSNGTLKKTATAAASVEQVAKLLPHLQEAVENAIAIEAHRNRYFHDANTVYFYEMISGYVDGEDFVPIRFGVKMSEDRNKLYVVVDGEKIKAEVIKTTTPINGNPLESRSAYAISLARLFANVNSSEILKYIPDGFLNEAQKDAKYFALSLMVKHTNEKNDRHYKNALASADMQEASRLVNAAAKYYGYTIKGYHGTSRADRVGNVFRPDRATSGPMAFFTDNKAIADNYARDKKDTSLAYDSEYDSYYTQFRVNRNGKNISIPELWKYLSFSEKNAIKEKAKHIKFDDDYENIIVDASAEHGNGAWDSYTLNMHRGNALEALVDTWLETGDLFDREADFIQVLDLVGIKGVEYRNPDARYEKTYDTWLKIQKPFDTDNANQSFYDSLSEWIENHDMSVYERETSNADFWDKNNQTPESWLEKLSHDIENGTTHAWTVIPDFVTDYLKEQGYDGIKDKGGKGGGAGHTVWIPFSSEQVKSADPITYDDNGNIIPLSERFNSENKDIRYSAEETDVILPSEDIEALNLENLRLKAENEALREQFYKTKIKKPKSEDIERVLTRITKNFELPEEDGERIRRRLREEYYQPRLNPTNDGRYKTLKGVMSKWKLEQNLESICNDIIESASILPESTYVTEAIAEAKDFLKDKDFIKTSDREVSELYDTLVDKFPEIFSADKNMRTRAKRHRIEEIVALPTLESTYITITDNAAIELQNFIMSSLIHPNLTYADKVDQRIRDIMNKNMERSSYYRQIIEHETYEAINAQMDDTHKRAMIIKMATRLGKMLNRPTKRNHIPEELRVNVAEALSHLNFGDKYANLNMLKESFNRILAKANEDGDVTLANRAEVVRDSLQSAEDSVKDFSDQYRYAVKALAEYYNELKTLVPESIFDSMDNSQKRTIARALATLEDVAKYSESDKANTIEFIKRRLNLTTVRVMENANKVMEKFVANEKELEFLETRTKVLLDNYKEYDQMSAEAIANYLASREKVDLKHLKGEALEYVYRAVLTINRIVTQENNMLVNQTKARRDALAKSAFSELESQRKGFWRKQIFDKRSGKIAIDQMDPSTVFELFGDTFNELFLNVERGVDTQTRINAEYADYMRELLAKYDYTKKKVNEDIKTFKLQSGEQLKLSLGEIMSIYLTARQTDGRFHLVNGGIKITPRDELKNYKIKEKIDVLKNTPSKFYRLTELDLDKILASLSEENIKFAESISDYLSKDLANELNEVSMRLYGYKMFTNPKYFGLKVSSDTTRNDVEAKNPGAKGAANPTLRSIGATQARKEKAGNRLNIRDVFSMTDDHVSTMSTWAAYVEPLTDFETVLNYKVDNAVTVKSKLEDVFGENAVSYFKNFIDRVNGSKNGTGEDLEAFYSKLIGATRSASTAANLSVIAKQPTSYLRTAQYIPAKTLLKHMLPIHKKGGYTDRMLKYSGLARMKELGYSDLAFGRRVGDTYDTSQNSLLTKFKDWTASGAANADRKTWSAIWAACEDITKNNPAFENVSEAQFYNEVNRLFNEIIMNTQVVRTTFTTPPALLSDSIVNKTIYAFKNEPYKQLNMIYRGFNRLQKAKASKDKAAMQSAAKYLVNGLIGIVFSQAITNVITVAAAVLRGWDDLDYVTDEDGERIGWFKYLLRKYAETSLWDAVSLVPIVGSIASDVAQGFGAFDSEANALEEAIGGLVSAFEKANDEDSDEGTKRTATGQLAMKSAQLLSNLSGIPVHTILRDMRAALTSLFKVLDIESHEYKVLTLTTNPSSAYYKQYLGAMLVEAINNSKNETFKGFNDVEYIKKDLEENYGWSKKSIQNLIDKFAVSADGVDKILAEMRGGKSIHSYNFSEYGTNAMGIAEVIESAINEDLKENKEDSVYYTEDLEKKQSKYYYTDMTDSAKKTIDTLVKNREALNSEFALCASGEDLYKSAVEAHDDGISYDNYLEAYLQIKAVESDKDYLGNTVEDSASEKKIAIINAITSNTKERQAMYKMFRVGITAQNNAILDDAIDAKINGNTTAYDAAIERYIINNKGADKKSATAEYEKRIAEIRKDLAKLSYDDPAEYARQLEYYRAGSVKKDFSADKMNEAKKEWLDSYTDSLARKLKKHRGDTEKEKLIYAEAAKYGIKERELNKRADKLK